LCGAAKGIEFYRLCARAHITALATYPEYMRILFQEGTWATERLAWLVQTHQSRLSLLIEQILARAQHEKLLPEMDLRHAKFIFSGAFCFPIVLAAEFKQLTGEDSQSEAFIERHIEGCLRLMLPGYKPAAKAAPRQARRVKSQ
jgi:TetR/AcrR family transcriptional regulator